MLVCHNPCQILSSLPKAAVHQQRTAPKADSQLASHGHHVSYNPASWIRRYLSFTSSRVQRPLTGTCHRKPSPGRVTSAHTPASTLKWPTFFVFNVYKLGFISSHPCFQLFDLLLLMLMSILKMVTKIWLAGGLHVVVTRHTRYVTSPPLVSRLHTAFLFWLFFSVVFSFYRPPECHRYRVPMCEHVLSLISLGCFFLALWSEHHCCLSVFSIYSWLSFTLSSVNWSEKPWLPRQ